MTDAVKMIRATVREAVRTNDLRLLKRADDLVKRAYYHGDIGENELYRFNRELRNCALICKGGADDYDREF